MTEKKSSKPTKTKKQAKPPMSKTPVVSEEAAVEAAVGPVVEAVVAPVVAPPAKPADQPKGQTKTKATGRTNGPQPTRPESPAEARSLDRESLLEVDTYDQAEALLSRQPDLIEPARVVFGSVVPTSGQNSFVELAISAAADDEALTLAEALQTKRRQHLNLTGPEVGQLLEFAAENAAKSPQLTLSIALLLTDDLTHLEDAALWGQQKELVLAAEKALEVDAAALWEEISGPKPKPQPEPEAPQPEPIKVEAVVEEEPEKVTPVIPPPVRVKQTRHCKKRHGVWAGPPRWMVATGFVFLLSMMSCGVCALTWF